MSMVVLFGLTSRPGLPCLRAAVASYLFHCVAISASFLLSPRGWSLCLNGRALTRALHTVTVPGLRRATSLRSVLRRAPDKCDTALCSLKHAQVLGDNGIVELDA